MCLKKGRNGSFKSQSQNSYQDDLAFVGETPTLNNKDEALECESEGKWAKKGDEDSRRENDPE